MEQSKNVLVSGASFAGLSTAYWMNKMGYKVTVIEVGSHLKKGGSPVNIEGNTVDIVKRMGIFEQIKANRLNMEVWEFKNTADITESIHILKQPEEKPSDDELEIERDLLLQILFDTVKNDVEFIFSESIIALNETEEEIQVSFKNSQDRVFDLVFGCDGIHSVVRKLWFGHETDYLHFLGAYFSITIVNKLLIRQNTMQMYSVPNKLMMLNAYNNKTDIVLSFRSETDIPYHYRDEEQQRKIILKQFVDQGWRIEELLEEVQASKTFYFDKFCQIKMPSWTKGRVALVGDAGYSASPAAGKGGSLAIDGAAALADAFQHQKGDFELAFRDYNKDFRPYITEVQADAARMLESLILRTEQAISKRNTEGFKF